MRRTVLAAIAAALLCAFPAVPFAATGGGDQPAQDGVPPETRQLEALKHTLNDPDARQHLVDQIDALIATRRGDDGAARQTGIVGMASTAASDLGAQISELLAALRTLPAGLLAAMKWFRQPGHPYQTLRVLLQTLWVLGPATIVFLLTRRFRHALRQRLSIGEGTPLPWHLLLLAARLCLAVLPSATAVVAGWLAADISAVAPHIRESTLLVIGAFAAVSAIRSGSGTLLSPHEGLGLPGVSPDTGAYLNAWIQRFAVPMGYGGFAIHLGTEFGARDNVVQLLYKLLGLLLTAMLIVVILQNRRECAESLRGDASPRSPRGRLAESWHVFAVLLVLSVYAAFAIGSAESTGFMISAIMLTGLIVVIALVASAALRSVLSRLFRLGGEITRRFPELAGRSNRYLPALQKLASGVVYVLAILALLQAWGLRGLEWLVTPTGQTVGAAFATIVLIIGFGLAVIEVASVLLERSLRDGGGTARRLTLLPLARNAVVLTVVLIGGLMALAQIGVNIGPLLAGAGVLGLAIGFGAQALVQDVITGFFILVEDSVSVGDWIDVGGHAGEVETLSLRSLRLRDLEGYVHTVPFSKVGTITNMTRDFNYALLDLQVAYRESVDEVIQLLQDVDSGLREEESWATDMIGPLDVFGLNSFGESALVIRARIRTRAGRHWPLRREFLRRLKIVFGEYGIEIPFPHRTLYFGADKNGEAPPAHVQVAGIQRDPSHEEPKRADNDSPATEPQPTEDDGNDGRTREQAPE